MQNFLKQVATEEKQITELDILPPARGTTPLGAKTLRIQSRITNPIMAFNDVRISAPNRGLKSALSFNSSKKSDHRQNKSPTKNNFTKENAPLNAGKTAGD